MKLTAEQFIAKAKAKHGDTYSYDKCVYVRARDRVTITCNIHGDFIQIAADHTCRSRKSGCPKCDREERAAAATKTTETYIKEAQKVHGDRYDYSQTEYKHSLQDVVILCKEHGPFQQTANNHLTGSGCRRCNLVGPHTIHSSPAKSHSTASFIQQAKSIHKDTYGYGKVEYINSTSVVTVTCRIHGDFLIKPISHIHGKAGCVKCGNEASAMKRRHPVEEFVRQATAKHGDRYDYSQVVYTNIDTAVAILCETHGLFKQSAYNHIRGQGCPSCAVQQMTDNKGYSTQTYIEAANNVHKEKYTYANCVYTGSNDKVAVSCAAHGDWHTKAYSHLQGKGCPRCRSSANSSKMQIQWLEWQAVKQGTMIQHSDNVGEHRIANSRYSADGYDPDSRTVYEFWGKFWHGDPREYASDALNHRTQTTFGELYKQTLKKREHILKEGYKLIDVWEIDWLADLKKVKTIQRAFRRWKQRRT